MTKPDDIRADSEPVDVVIDDAGIGFRDLTAEMLSDQSDSLSRIEKNTGEIARVLKRSAKDTQAAPDTVVIREPVSAGQPAVKNHSQSVSDTGSVREATVFSGYQGQRRRSRQTTRERMLARYQNDSRLQSNTITQSTSDRTSHDVSSERRSESTSTTDSISGQNERSSDRRSEHTRTGSHSRQINSDRQSSEHSTVQSDTSSHSDSSAVSQESGTDSYDSAIKPDSRSEKTVPERGAGGRFVSRQSESVAAEANQQKKEQEEQKTFLKSLGETLSDSTFVHADNDTDASDAAGMAVGGPIYGAFKEAQGAFHDLTDQEFLIYKAYEKLTSQGKGDPESVDQDSGQHDQKTGSVSQKSDQAEPENTTSGQKTDQPEPGSDQAGSEHDQVSHNSSSVAGHHNTVAQTQEAVSHHSESAAQDVSQETGQNQIHEAGGHEQNSQAQTFTFRSEKHARPPLQGNSSNREQLRIQREIARHSRESTALQKDTLTASEQQTEAIREAEATASSDSKATQKEIDQLSSTVASTSASSGGGLIESALDLFGMGKDGPEGKAGKKGGFLSRMFGAGGSASAGGGALSKLAGVGSKALGALAAPVAGVLAYGNKSAELAGREDLTEDQKKTQAISTGIGAGGGALAGAAAGAAMGSVVPVVGTVIGGILGGIAGSFGGEWLGSSFGKMIAGGDGQKVETEKTLTLAEQVALEREQSVSASQSDSHTTAISQSTTDAETDTLQQNHQAAEHQRSEQRTDTHSETRTSASDRTASSYTHSENVAVSDAQAQSGVLSDHSNTALFSETSSEQSDNRVQDTQSSHSDHAVSSLTTSVSAISALSSEYIKSATGVNSDISEFIQEIQSGGSAMISQAIPVLSSITDSVTSTSERFTAPVDIEQARIPTHPAAVAQMNSPSGGVGNSNDVAALSREVSRLVKVISSSQMIQTSSDRRQTVSESANSDRFKFGTSGLEHIQTEFTDTTLVLMAHDRI